MKKFIIAGFALFAFVILLFSDSYTFTNGSPAARSGGAGENSCATSSCHVGNANTGPGMVSLTSDALNNEYTPGATYTITATVMQTGISKFGFEVLTGFSTVQNASLGTVQLINTGATQLKVSGQRDYVTHRSGGTAGTADARSWTFEWIAPASGSGEVSFFGAYNATNAGGNRTGDNVYTTSFALAEGPVSIDPVLTAQPKLDVFPTYTNEVVNIQMEDIKDESVSISALNLQGQVLYTTQEAALGGILTHQVRVARWESGLYYLRINGEEWSVTRKLIKY